MKQLAIVTGASSGIGKAVAKKFLELGYEAVLADRNPDRLRAAEEGFGAWKGRFTCCETDVADAGSIDALIVQVRRRKADFHVLVNCAGVFRGGLLHEAAAEDYDVQFDVNVKGTCLMMKAVLPLMLEAHGGSIVNVASVSGIRGDYNAPLYCASKGAVISLTRAAALDYMEKGIRINCVSPSATATPMFLSGTGDGVMRAFKDALPDHKIGLPEQVADAVVFLASPQAAHICGHNLPVDGGLTAWNGQPRQDKDA